MSFPAEVIACAIFDPSVANCCTACANCAENTVPNSRVVRSEYKDSLKRVNPDLNKSAISIVSATVARAVSAARSVMSATPCASRPEMPLLVRYAARM